LELPPPTFKEHWSYATDALEAALELLCDRYGCFGERFIPLVDMIAPMAVVISSRKFKHTDDHLRMLDRWYWRSVFSQYFISSTETKLQRTVRQWVSGDAQRGAWLDDASNEPDSVRDFSYRASILDDVSRNDNAIYRGVISLLLSRGACDFGRERRRLALVSWEEIEDHHIYPKRFLGPYGIKGERVNNIANRTPLLRSTNGACGNIAPHVYLKDVGIVGMDPIEPTLKLHLINSEIAVQPFTEKVYEQFMVDRTAQIISAISAVVGTEPLQEEAAA
jgi:hypothetical protein